MDGWPVRRGDLLAVIGRSESLALVLFERGAGRVLATDADEAASIVE